MSTSARNPLRGLPSVDALITSAGGAALVEQYGRSPTLEALRAALDEARTRLRAADPPVIARIVADQVVFDPRTVLPGQTDPLLRAIRSAL